MRWYLRWGLRAFSMDDRWTVFEESGTLFFCRSWTGNCIYKMVLGEGDTHDVYAAPGFVSEDFDKTFRILHRYRLGPCCIPLNVIPHGVRGNIIPLMPRSGMSVGLNSSKGFGIHNLNCPGFLGELFNQKDDRRGPHP